MVLLVRIVLALIGLFFLVAGLRFMFAPEVMAAAFFVSADGAAGLSTVRGDLGGAFVAVAAFVALGLLRSTLWLHAAAAVIGAVALGRAVGFLFDGLAASAVTAFVIELVFVGLLVIGARRLRAA